MTVTELGTQIDQQNNTTLKHIMTGQWLQTCVSEAAVRVMDK